VLQFEWDDDNTSHIARHGITPEEAEQVLTGSPLAMEGQLRSGEQRTLCAGRTAAGKAVAVVYTLRGGRIRVVTAFAANRRLRTCL
jgi:uncharacterized protein